VYLTQGESGDPYDIDMQIEPIAKALLEFKAPSLTCSVRSLDTAESGDAYDAEVDQSFGGELETAQFFKPSVGRR